jgi:hypothetical protein
MLCSSLSTGSGYLRVGLSAGAVFRKSSVFLSSRGCFVCPWLSLCWPGIESNFLCWFPSWGVTSPTRSDFRFVILSAPLVSVWFRKNLPFLFWLVLVLFPVTQSSIAQFSLSAEGFSFFRSGQFQVSCSIFTRAEISPCLLHFLALVSPPVRFDPASRLLHWIVFSRLVPDCPGLSFSPASELSDQGHEAQVLCYSPCIGGVPCYSLPTSHILSFFRLCVIYCR